MPRIRSIHPGQATDEDFVAMSMAARLFALHLRCEADDYGVFEWKPMGLKMRLFPVDNVDIEALLAELALHRQITSFEHDGRRYGAIRNFCKWQRPKKPVQVHHLPGELREWVALDQDAEANLRKRKWDIQGGKCFYCRTEITYYSKKHHSLEIDHRQPVSRGGTDDDDNLVAACRACNRAKNDMTDSEYREWMREKKKSRAKDENSAAKSDNSLQREDVGGRREDEGGNSDPDGSGAMAPIPPAEIVPAKAEPPEQPPLAIPIVYRQPVDGDWRKLLFDVGLPFLRSRYGGTDDAHRPLLGRWLKATGDDARAVVQALGEAEQKDVADLKSWMMARLGGRKPDTSVRDAFLAIAGGGTP